MGRQLKQKGGNNMTKEERKALAEELKSRQRCMAEKHEFVPGQLVRWKKGLENRQNPGEEEPAVVVSVLREPLCDAEGDSGNFYFREPLDLVVGIRLDSGRFQCLHVDSRRFEPYDE